MNYANVLVRNYPGTRWKMKNSSDYDTLEWYDESSKPSKDEPPMELIEIFTLIIILASVAITPKV